MTKGAASAAGAFASGEYATVYDGLQRVLTRQGHGFTEEAATRKMHGDFVSAHISRRHVIQDPLDKAGEVVAMIEALRSTGHLTFEIR